MGWLRWVGCLKIYVSLQNIGLFCRSLLQKRPIFLSILLIVATPYVYIHIWITFAHMIWGVRMCVNACVWNVCVYMYIYTHTYIYIQQPPAHISRSWAHHEIHIQTHTFTQTHTSAHIRIYAKILSSSFIYKKIELIFRSTLECLTCRGLGLGVRV